MYCLKNNKYGWGELVCVFSDWKTVDRWSISTDFLFDYYFVPFIHIPSIFPSFIMDPTALFVLLKLKVASKWLCEVVTVALTEGNQQHPWTRMCTHRSTLKLMRQIYDSCWPQQIKLTVMYVWGQMSFCTNRPHTLWHRPVWAPVLPVLPVRWPPPAYLHNEIPHADVSFPTFLFFLNFSFLSTTCICRLIPLPASCHWRMASPLMTTGQCISPSTCLLLQLRCDFHRFTFFLSLSHIWGLKTKQLVCSIRCSSSSKCA